MEINKAVAFFISALRYEQLSTHTLRAYMQDLKQWEKSIEKIELDTLDFEDFQNYFINLQQQDLKITSLRRKRVVIHRFLKFCYDKKLCDNALFTYIDPIKTKKNNMPKEVLHKEEIKAIMDYLKGEIERYKHLVGVQHYDYLYYCAVRNQLIINILLYTGCRANEVMSLKKQDIDKQNNSITILAKGHKYNVIPIHEVLIEAFATYEKEMEELEHSQIKQSVLSSFYMFPSKKISDEHLSTRTLHDLMGKLSGILGRSIHAHLFRHTFASYCIAANIDIATLSALISHSNPAITLSIYTHEIQGNQKQQEMKKLTFE